MAQIPLAKHPLAFTDKQTRLLKLYIARLVNKTSSSQAVLADVSGRLVLCYGKLSLEQCTGLGSLAAGSFAAGTEIYNFLGTSEEQEFDTLLLEGEPNNLLISQIENELLLILAFAESSMMGSIRIYAEQVCQEVSKIVKVASVRRRMQTKTGLFL